MPGQRNIAVRAEWAQPTTHHARIAPGALVDRIHCGSQDHRVRGPHEVATVRRPHTRLPERVLIFDGSSRAPGLSVRIAVPVGGCRNR